MTDASSKALLNVLRLAKKQDDASNTNWEKQKADWLKDLAALMGDIRAWLWPAVTEALVGISDAPLTLCEEYLGTYQAPGLTLTMPKGRLVEVRPVGRLVLGALGRVDLLSGPKVTILLRAGQGRWKVRIPLGTAAPAVREPLTRAKFAQALQELIA